VSESGEKQFDPTPSRLSKAKSEGDIPRASELGANLALAAGALATIAIIPLLGMQFRTALITASTVQTPLAVFAACASLLAFGLIPIAAGAIAGAAASMAQSGGFAFIAPAFKLERIDPFSGIKRLLSRQTLAQCGRAILAFSIAVGASVAGLTPLIGVALQGSSVATLASVAWRAVLQSIFVACGVGLIFALLEYGAARNAWLKRLRLSFDEYKRSIKEQDGDAQLRGRRRSFHRALARSDLRHVRKAAFVVCNPTHIAIALAYAPPDEPVPRVLVRAADDLAMRVRDIATEHNVPLVENIELARALYADAATGSPIPHVHYLAVAEVVAVLQKQKKLNDE
jgi:flagellar biosynthetic protein FlhB